MPAFARTLLIFASLSVSAAFADAVFSVSGVVKDSSGAAVSAATVQLFSRNSSETYAAVTNTQGHFQVRAPGGEYLLQAHAPGLNLAKAHTVSLHAPVQEDLELGIPETSSSVTVTATGTAQSLDELAKSLNVVPREQFDQLAVNSVSDALREVPGVRIAQRGGPGSFATVQTRGLRSFDTAFLVDGMRFRDVGATQGDASSFISDLLLVDTSRIEVLRGAGSSLYGTNAMGGVINVVTDSGSGALHGDVLADGGGLGSFRALGRLGGGAWGNRFHYSGGIGHQDVTNGVGGYGRYRNTTGNGTVDYSFRPGLVLSARLLATDAFAQLYNSPSTVPSTFLPASGSIQAVALPDAQIRLAEAGLPYNFGNATFVPALGDPDSYRTARYASTMVALQQQVSAPLSYRLSYQALLSDRDVVNGPGGPGFQSPYRTVSSFNGRIDTLRAQGNFVAGPHNVFSAGYEFEREFFDSPSTDGNPVPSQQVNSRTKVSERSNTVDAQDQIRLLRDRLQISLSGRWQHFELSKPEFLGNFPVYASAASLSPPNAYTGDVSVAYFLRRTGTKLRAHGGNGYRKPSLYELFGTYFSGSSFTAYGDPRLKPERSIAGDAGIDQYLASDRLRLSATYFYTRLQQVIAFDFSGLVAPGTDPFGRSSGYLNTGGGLARGVELSLESKPLRSTMVRASYTYTNARDRVSQFGDGTLQTPRIIPHTFSAVITQQWKKGFDAALEFLAGSDFLYPLSRRTFVFEGSRSLGLSSGWSHAITEKTRARFYGRVNNAVNQNYYEDGFRTPTIWATGGIAVSF